jgi:nitrilase
MDGRQAGGCRIIAPGGDVIAQAAVDEETVLTASVSLEAVLKAKAAIDVGGHYSRPDVFQLYVNRRPLERLVVSDVGAAAGDDRIPSKDEGQEETKEIKSQ